MTELAPVLARLGRMVDWERRERREMRVAVAPARDLLARLGEPQSRWKAVHVAGTKGKGSVCALVAAGLARAGLRVGVYASPHVERMNERVRLDGREVDDGPLGRALSSALDAREAACAAGSAGRDATWFDVVTAAAFSIFAEAGVEWAVVEVGLGGRLDSTNALPAPEVCVITGIDLEHTSVLGATRTAIAREKAGILKAGTVLVTGLAPDGEAGAVVLARARELGVPVRRVAHGANDGFEARNAVLAGAALDALGARGHAGEGGRPLSAALLDEAARAAARLPGRLERRSLGGRSVVLDGAHVPESVELLLRELARDPGLRGLPSVVLCLGKDKQIERLLAALAPHSGAVFCTSVPSGVHLPAAELCERARRAGLDAEACEDPRAALEAARAAAPQGGWVLVTGSLYLVGAVRALTGPGSEPTRASEPPG